MKFRVGKTRFIIGYEAVAAMTAVLLLDRDGRVICCFLASLLHETGHLLMMRLCRCTVRELRLGLFDVKIVCDPVSGFKDDVLITVAGVAVNLILSAVCAPFSQRLSISNLVIGIFNLLPLESLDGGRLLTLLLLRKFSAKTTDRVIRILSFLFLVPFLFCGAALLFQTRYNYSLLAVSLYLLGVLIIR